MAFLQEYTMLDEIGKGGFATVYKVRHNDLGYIRAIRVLNDTIVNSASETYQKFLRECKILLRLGNGSHPNIVHIYQPRLLDNKALVEMDYVDGQDIMHYLRQNQNFVSAEEVIRMATQISSALAYCHEDIYRFSMDRDIDMLQDDPNDGSKVLVDEKTREKLIQKYKVIHNDIHSGNIMRRENGNFVLLDFGLAINGTEIVRSSRHANGAPEFKAPEKWDNEALLTEQSDIYSFGIVLYQYLAGRVPFPYDTKNSNSTAEEFKLMNAHKTATPPSIEAIRKEFFEKKFEGQEYEPDFPKWLEEAILICLRKNPAERFRNGKELYEFIVGNSQTSKALCNDVEIERLTKENREMAAQVNDLNGTNLDLQDKLSTTQNECDTLKNDLTQTKLDLDAAKHKIEELKETSGKPKPIINILLVLLTLIAIGGISMNIYNRNHRTTSGSGNVSETQIEELQATISQQKTDIKNLNQQIKAKDHHISEQNKEIETLKKNNPVTSTSSTEVTSLKKQLSEKEQEIKRLNNQINDLKLQIDAKNSKIKDLEDKLKKSSSSQTPSSDVTMLQQKLKQSQQEVSRLNNQLDQKAKALNKANQEIEILKKNCL